MNLPFLCSLSITFLISLPFFSFAGHVIGNGGVVLKCNDNNRVYFRSYDTTEMEILSGEPTELSLKSTAKEKALELVGRLKRINPNRYYLYRMYIENFETDAHFLPVGVKLVKTNDISIGVYPENCEIEQAIVQKNFAGIDEKIYLVNTSIWKALDEDTKAALMVHEVIFREGLKPENGHINSVFTRQFTQLLHSKKIFSISLQDFHEFLVNNFFATADSHDGFPIVLFVRTYFPGEGIHKYPLEYWNPNIIKSAFPGLKASMKYKDVFISYDCSCSLALENLGDANLSYYVNGGIQDLAIFCARVELPIHIPQVSGSLYFKNFRWSENQELVIASSNSYDYKKVELLYRDDRWVSERFRHGVEYRPKKQLAFIYDALVSGSWLKNGQVSNEIPRQFLWDSETKETRFSVR